MPEYEYSITELQDMYLEAHPTASRSKARREAQKMHRQMTANPGRILGIPWLCDPTPREAVKSITRNDLAAARRLGLA